MNASLLLQQFAKTPVPGAVKTRLMPELSAEEACQVHCELAVQTAGVLQAYPGACFELWIDGDRDDEFMNGLLPLPGDQLFTQQGADLGERMAFALSRGARRAERVLLVGSDCPILTVEFLGLAARALDQAPAVLGPADDGGYVLIGCRTRVAATMKKALAGIQWGTDRALVQTIHGMEAQGVKPALLPTLFDVDTPDDLRRWRTLQA
ncbi:MAG: TIGR04282 family arsenosugar biosynthesis glycosyltransferase [Pseudomonadota bacterium]